MCIYVYILILIIILVRSYVATGRGGSKVTPEIIPFSVSVLAVVASKGEIAI